MRRFETAAAPHWAPRTSVRRVMLKVAAALVPGTLAHVWFFGPGVLVQIALAVAFALAIEAAMLRVRGQPVRPFLTDGSALVTAWLFAVCVPPLAPWWIAAVAMLAAIALAKHLYGGLGHNLFNPAMVGYAVVLVCFPLELSRWLAPGDLAPAAIGLRDTLAAIFAGVAPGGDWDAITRATPLDLVRQLGAGGRTLAEVRADPVFGDFGGRGWEWIANLYILGGIALCLWRVADWRTPVAVLGTTIALTLPFWLADPDLHPLPLQHVFSGALVLAAFFIATDPVSGCTTPRGRWIFGAGVAILTLAIRRWGGYPDGVAFAVLLMNAAAPLIDRLTPPRIFGR
jgi:electron transport complex protein RnfD